MELIQFAIDTVAPQLLREHENTVTMLCAIVAVADEDAWRALIFTSGGSHKTYLGRIPGTDYNRRDPPFTLCPPIH